VKGTKLQKKPHKNLHATPVAPAYCAILMPHPVIGGKDENGLNPMKSR